MNTLSRDQIEQFIELGYLVLPECFPREVAQACVDFLWDQIEEDRDDPATWTRARYRLEKGFRDAPFDRVINDSILGAMDQLMGPGRSTWTPAYGGWPITFPGFAEKPWTPPEKGWHVDGIQFYHHLWSPNQGLLPIVIFSDIEPGDGGTCISVGSHKITARILAEAEPHGLDIQTLCQRVNQHPRQQVLEMTAPAGSFVLLHPFMLHAASENAGNRVRFICNPCPSVSAPMRFDRQPPDAHSPVEEAIRRALDPRAR